MNYTIDQQLSRLETFKTALKNVINQANPSHPLTSNRLDDFLTHISTYLGPKEDPVQQFTVTFNKNGGSGTAPTAQTVAAGTVIQLPSYNGTKSGYSKVNGWATSSSATTAQYGYGDSFTVTANVTLYAVFVELPSYTVTFNKNGGSGTAPTAQIVESGTVIQLPSYTGTKSGHIQVPGWATSASATTAQYSFNESYTVTGNVTLYAVFVESIEYTVTFDKNGGSGTAPTAQTVAAGTVIQLPAYTGTKVGYTQVTGWSASASSTIAEYQVGDNYTVTANKTLYAVFTVNKYKVSWTNPSNGGTITAKVGSTNIVNNSTLVEYNKTVTLTYTPPTGRTVSSLDWIGGQTSIVIITPGANNTGTFTMPDAYVKGITANVDFKPQAHVIVTSEQPEYGSVSGTGYYDLGTTATIKADPKEGCSFVKWSDDSNENPREILIETEEELTFKAIFEAEIPGVKVNCVEYLCKTDCAEFELEDFKQYKTHKEQINDWFVLSEHTLNWYMDGELQYFGKLSDVEYTDEGSGVDIDDSNTMYWIAVPVEYRITNYIANYGTDFPEDLIEKFNQIDQALKFENVRLNGNEYNVYGTYGKTRIHIKFANNN